MSTLTHHPDSEEVADRAGRIGLAARGFVYCLLGVLALALALGGTSEGDQVDQRGALKELAEKPLGKPLLVALIVGFLAYTLWRALRMVNGEGGKPPNAKSRTIDAAKVVVYLGFAYSAFKIVKGDDAEEQREQEFTARLMTESWGRWAVGLAGLVFVGVGLYQGWKGISRKFRKRLTEVMGDERQAVVTVGVIGHVARGIVIGVIGGLLIRAAVRFDAAQPVGVDAALKEVLSHSYGPFVVAGVAVGLFAFGLYSFAEARYRAVS